MVPMEIQMRACLASITLLLGISHAAAQPADRLPGKPAARPLPEWCQMGECVTTTVEYTTPVLFDRAGTLFLVGTQTWSYHYGEAKKKTRDQSQGPSYVFCSKENPAVMTPSKA